MTLDPAPILRQAFSCGAASVVLFHNHPNGDPTPSPKDLTFTQRVVEACDLVGLVVLDHVIVGAPLAFVSLRRRGLY